MVLVFILLSIIIFLLLVCIIFVFSVVQIEIKNLKIGNKEIKNENIVKDKYEIKITFYFLNKIPILWFRLNNNKLRKISNSKQLEKIDFKKIEKQVSIKEIIEFIKNIKIKISKLDLNIDIGTEDAIITSYINAFISSIIGIILPHVVEKDKIEKCHYIVTPIYKNRNEYHISLDSIISIKIVHIINSMLNFVKKGREEYERSSNRRSYDYCYEQYKRYGRC